MEPQDSRQTLNTQEVTKFSALAREWWNPEGKFKPLHAMNPARLTYIREKIEEHFFLAVPPDGSDKPASGPGPAPGPDPERPLAGLKLLDVGCGGGLVCEPLARLGGEIMGIDASQTAVHVAQQHAQQSGLTIEYRVATIETLDDSLDPEVLFHGALGLEIVEHVENPALFVARVARRVRPGGLLVFSTLNRNWWSYLGAILAAEYVLRLLPVGTHDWRQFLKPAELAAMARKADLRVVETIGFVPEFAFYPNQWRLSRTNLRINYLLVAEKPLG